MAEIHLCDIEAAIDWWRARSPSTDGLTACPEVRALAEVAAQLGWRGRESVDEAELPRWSLRAWMEWYAQTPDTPCIAICSTAQGDAVCKGCGRTEVEVQHWPRMSPAEKRTVWRRITREAAAWRFNRYAERVRQAAPIADPAPAAARETDGTAAP